MHGLKVAGIDLDRRVLADLAVNEPARFADLVGSAKKALRFRDGGSLSSSLGFT